MSDRPIRILLVEDNPDDVRLTKAIFADAGLSNQLMIANDGEQALALLGVNLDDMDGELADVTLPDLIAIDLNLPKLDGRELLDILKHNYRLSNIPLIILTGSIADRDLTVAHMLDAKVYIEKPLDVTSLVEAVQTYHNAFGFTITHRNEPIPTQSMES